MTLPGILIIGAMKCGSTTLYHDLCRSDQVFSAIDKETDRLIDDKVLTPSGLAEYEKLYALAKPGQLCLDSSTAYSKLSIHPGVAQRARLALGDEAKIVYIVRDPIRRIESHFHHCITSGVWSDESINKSIDERPDLIDFSRYATQIEPWIATFGNKNVRIVIFEHYMKNRQESCLELWRWLGVDGKASMINEGVVFNSSTKKPIMVGPFAKIAQTGPYRKLVRPLLNQDHRNRLRQLLLPKTKSKSPQLDPQIAERVRGLLVEEISTLSILCKEIGLGHVDPAPIWGFAHSTSEASA